MTLRLRAPIATGIDAIADAPQVDVEAGIIRGASAMQAVEALGHDVLIDDLTLAAIAGLGNATEGGVKVRYTHPGLCGDGLGTYLGRMRDFRVEGDKVVGDIHLGQAAAASPDGDLRAYVLQLAKEDPSAFGMSVVVEGGRMWKCASGTEVEGDRPADAVGDLPYLRPTGLFAVDVVDEPAANRDGLFGRGAALLAMARGTNLDAQEAFAVLDRIREQLGWPAEKATALLAAYLQARTAKPAACTVEQVAALVAAHPADAAVILARAAAKATEADIVSELTAAKVTALAASSTALLARYETETADLKKQVAALTEQLAKAQALAQLAVGAPADLGTSEGETVMTATEFAAMSPTARSLHIRQHGVASIVPVSTHH